ncbi:unnamed protein product [Chrysoparadoxa australica]
MGVSFSSWSSSHICVEEEDEGVDSLPCPKEAPPTCPTSRRVSPSAEAASLFISDPGGLLLSPKPDTEYSPRPRAFTAESGAVSVASLAQHHVLSPRPKEKMEYDTILSSRGFPVHLPLTSAPRDLPPVRPPPTRAYINQGSSSAPCEERHLEERPNLHEQSTPCFGGRRLGTGRTKGSYGSADATSRAASRSEDASVSSLEVPSDYGSAHERPSCKDVRSGASSPEGTKSRTCSEGMSSCRSSAAGSIEGSSSSCASQVRSKPSPRIKGRPPAFAGISIHVNPPAGRAPKPVNSPAAGTDGLVRAAVDVKSPRFNGSPVSKVQCPVLLQGFIRDQPNNSHGSGAEGGASASPEASSYGGSSLSTAATPVSTKLGRQVERRDRDHCGSLLDDEDWIVLGDDEVNLSLSPRQNRKPSLSVNCESKQDEGYTITQSGAINLNGFGSEIRETGIVEEGRPGCGVHVRDRLVILSKLGQGATGVVYKAFDLVELRLVALKVVPVFDKTKRTQLIRELKTLYSTLYLNRSKGDGSGVVHFFDAFLNKEEGAVCLMVEYMDGGSLQDIVDRGGVSCEETLGMIAYQCLKGLQHIHRCKQIHRDLKPANVLINRQGHVKISDFGIVRRLEEPTPRPDTDTGSSTNSPEAEAEACHSGDGDASSLATSSEEGAEKAAASSGRSTGSGSVGCAADPCPDQLCLKSANTFVGTLTYMSPERISGLPYSFASDVWSLGLSLLATAEGRPPIQGAGGYWSVVHTIRDSPPPRLTPGKWSREFESFVVKCLCKDSTQRPTPSALEEHEFLGVARKAFANGTPAAEVPTEEAMARNFEDMKLLLAATEAHLRARSKANPSVFQRLTNRRVESCVEADPPASHLGLLAHKLLYCSAQWEEADARLRRLSQQLCVSPSDLLQGCAGMVQSMDQESLLLPSEQHTPVAGAKRKPPQAKAPKVAVPALKIPPHTASEAWPVVGSSGPRSPVA